MVLAIPYSLLPTLSFMQWIDDELADRRRLGLYRVRRCVESAQGVRISYRGRTFLNFSSNDYLNLAADPRLARAAASAARRHGTGAGASPLVSGHLPPLRQLERDLARWQHAEKVLVCSSGYTANLAAISSLADAETVIFSDALNHASLIDGCRLSRGRVHIYRHADANHLDDLLKKESSSRRKIIVSDTVFSMDGDFAPLPELCQLARRHDCLLVVDEAHATGIFGEAGQGLCQTLQGEIDPERLVKIGTLSKSLGSQGGFICGTKKLIAYLVNRARPYIFSTALAPSSAAAARRAVAIVEAEPDRRRHLLRLAGQLRKKLGHEAGDVQSPIVPVIIGEARAATKLSNKLEAEGLLVPAIRPPSVPAGTSRLRISLTAGHTEADIEQLMAVLVPLRRACVSRET
jgi:8-amino-7-oxononanoate synthase